MKYIAMIIATLMLAISGNDLRVVVLTPTPAMHCDNCETTIKENMRFEKGVKKIETDRDRQTVTITYDSRKTDVATLQAAMKKIGRDTKIVSDQPVAKKQKAKKQKKAE